MNEELKRYIGHSNFTILLLTTTEDSYEYVVKEDDKIYPYVIVQTRSQPILYVCKPYIAKRHI